MRNLHALRLLSTKLELPGSLIQFTTVNYEQHILYATDNANMLLGIHMLSGEVRLSTSKFSRGMPPPLPSLALSCPRPPMRLPSLPYFAFVPDLHLCATVVLVSVPFRFASVGFPKVVLELDLGMEESNRVVAVQYVPDTESVVVATSGGDILAIERVSGSSPELDCIGSIETGIVSMSWSPDFEVVVFTTRADTMLMMTQDWETIFEFPLRPENEAAQITARLALAEPSKIKLQTTINDVARVNETKSQIVAQMQLAKESMPTLPLVGHHSITWRGDGQFFAISSPTSESGEEVNPLASQFRVWERNGKFYTKSESGVFTQSVLLAWKPSGDVLASVQSLPTHDEVIFFERNGLRHYEFKIRPKGSRVLDLQWNASSDILSTLVRLPPNGEGQSLALLLWSTRNYHWYLKREMLFTEKHASVNWDPENGMIFTVTTENGDIQQHTLCWDTDISHGTQSHPVHGMQVSKALENNHSVAAVIDGSQLLITALKYQVVPPPMSTATIAAHTTINEVTYDLSNNLVLLHADGSLSLYEHYRPLIEVGKPPKYNIMPKFLARSSETTLKGCRQITAVGNDELLVLNASSSSDIHQESLLHLRFEVISEAHSESETVHRLKISELESTPLPRVSRMFQNADTGGVFLQLADMSILHYDVLDRMLTPKPSMKLPSICPWLSSAIFADGDELLVGLTSSFKLHVGDSLVSSECTSFALHSDFLLFTTLTHRLRTISLHKTVHENLLVLTPKQNIKFDDSTREVEQGSLIVAVTPESTRVVLQMPRGNLEAIEPRSLVLNTIRHLLDAQEYKKAFEVMRKQRINLNFFYDHNPTLFMDHIGEFLDQTSDLDHLNLFISSLTSEDCTKTIYVDVFGHAKRNLASAFVSAASLASHLTPLPSGPSKGLSAKAAQYIMPIHTDDAAIKERLQHLKIGKPDSNLSHRKVNSVCDTLRQLMEKRDAERYLLPILTALVCKDPAEVETALRLVQTIRRRELEASGASSTTTMASSTTSEKALKYLVFLVDVNKLYDIALSMYDFDLVILVAQKSQKDPREYLPFLGDLQKQDTYFQRYNIDMHLQKWESALVNLAKAGEAKFEKCLELIQKRNLYVFALSFSEGEGGGHEIVGSSAGAASIDLFSVEQRNAILELYGDHLNEGKEYSKAILAYKSGGKLGKAFECAMVDADWRQAVAFAHQLGLPQKSVEEWHAYLNDLVAACLGRFKYEDAATVLERFLQRPHEAFTVLLDGYLWEHAQLLCHQYGMAEKLQEELVPAILSAQESILKTVQERTVKLSKYHNRLITVRANKYLQAQSEAAPTIEGSETSSMYSGSSQSSAHSKSSKASKGSKASKASKASRASSSSSSNRNAGKGKVTGRKGSPNEEQFLVQELPGLLPPTRTQQEVADLLRVLFQYGHIKKAVELSKALQEWIARGTRALALINTPSPLTREEKQDFDASRMGADELQIALVDPQKIPNATLKPIDWKLSMLPN